MKPHKPRTNASDAQAAKSSLNSTHRPVGRVRCTLRRNAAQDVAWGRVLLGEERSVRTRARCVSNYTRTNLRNKGLISADRRTSLLSCLQYPGPYLSRLQRIYLSQCFTCDDV